MLRESYLNASKPVAYLRASSKTLSIIFQFKVERHSEQKILIKYLTKNKFGEREWKWISVFSTLYAVLDVAQMLSDGIKWPVKADVNLPDNKVISIKKTVGLIAKSFRRL